MSLPVKKNVPPRQINVPRCQINVPLTNKFPKFLRQNHDPWDIYLQEGCKFVSFFTMCTGPCGIFGMHVNLLTAKKHVDFVKTFQFLFYERAIKLMRLLN